MTDLVALKQANERRWANAKLLRPGTFNAVARHLVDRSAKARYQAVSTKTGVPWPFIAVAHERECSQDWTGSLAQGDPWNRVSVHVPAERGHSDLGKKPRLTPLSIAHPMQLATGIGALEAR